MENSNQPDWKISELYSEAWKVIKKNKVLWLFGMAALTLSSNFSSHSSNLNNNSTAPSTHSATQTLNTFVTPFAQDTQKILSSVPSSSYILLSLAVALLILLGVVLNLIYSAWATGSLLRSTQTAINGTPLTIAGASSGSFIKIKPLIWLNIIPLLVFTVIAALTIIVLIVLDGLVPGAARAIPILLTTVAVIAALIGFVLITMAKIWASRLIVLENQNAKSAFFAGLHLSKDKFWSTLFLGIINSVFSLAVTVIPLLIIAGFGIFAFLSLKNPGRIFGPGFWVSIATGSLFLVLIYSVGAGILNAFKATIWTLAYQKIKGKLSAK